MFAGIGGNRTLWGDKHEITAIEFIPSIANIYQKRFPNDHVYITDAYKYLEENYKEFDFIWASPPCPTHSKLQHIQKFKKLPDMRLYSLIIFLKYMFKGKWVIENVEGYYKPLINPTVKLDRHLFWANYPIKKRDFKVNYQDYVIDLTTRKNGHQDLNVEELSNLKKVDFNLVKNVIGLRKILRNMVRPKVGKYILDCCINKKQKTLENY